MCALTVRIEGSRYLGGLRTQKVEKMGQNGHTEEVGSASEKRVVMFVSALSVDKD
jgi:hypothetical protein